MNTLSASDRRAAVQDLVAQAASVAVIDKASSLAVPGAELILGNLALTDFDTATGAVARVLERFGRLDGLVNAGNISVADTARWSCLDMGPAL
jgi:hypothetical protein